MDSPVTNDTMWAEKRLEKRQQCQCFRRHREIAMCKALKSAYRLMYSELETFEVRRGFAALPIKSARRKLMCRIFTHAKPGGPLGAGHLE